jgi:hypothetical protein
MCISAASLCDCIRNVRNGLNSCVLIRVVYDKLRMVHFHAIQCLQYSSVRDRELGIVIRFFYYLCFLNLPFSE